MTELSLPGDRGGARQLPLRLSDLLPHRVHCPGERIVAACNRKACRFLDAYPDWPWPGLLLEGPEGAGKTHLARHFADRAGATLLTAASLAAVDPVSLAEEPVVVDGLEELTPAGEAALFHLVNALAASGRHLLVTSKGHGMAGIATADLASRLRLLVTVRVDPPDDAVLATVIGRAFKARQLEVDGTVVAYLLRRIPRSLKAADQVAAALDREALARKRPVTRSLAADIVGSLFPDRAD